LPGMRANREGMRITKGTTLLELLVAVILVSVIVLAIANIDLFSRFQIISSDRRAVLQNQVSFALEHMSKNLVRAIGDFNLPAINITTNPGGTEIRAWIDASGDGKRGSGDCEIAYRFTGYQIWYYEPCCSSTPELIARNIASLVTNPGVGSVIPNTTTGNRLDITIAARWKPQQAKSVDNPEVAMSASIQMPSVSTN